MVEFGEQLRKAREEKGMTQQTLAEQLFVTRYAVSKWECGERYPDLPTTQKIAEVLDVSLDDLLSGKDMAKAVEINPVVEKKSANNIMIAMFAFILFANMPVLVYFCLTMPNYPVSEWSSVWFIIFYSILDIMEVVFRIAIISYGLILAIREMLSPKRMGVVIVAYLVTVLLYNICINIPTWIANGPDRAHAKLVISMLALETVSTFIFFF